MNLNPWWNEERSENMAIYYVIDIAKHPEKADRVLSIKKVYAKNPAYARRKVPFSKVDEYCVKKPLRIILTEVNYKKLAGCKP